MNVTTEQAPAPAPPPPTEPPNRRRRLDWARLGRGLAGLATNLVPVAISLGIALLVGSVVILAVRRDVGDLFDVGYAMWDYGLQNRDSVALILSRATPLILSGLAAAIAFRAGLFNIGVEGQYAIGLLTAAAVGSTFGGLPTVLLLPLTLLGGIAGGMLWAVVPAVLKAYRGANEVISTIMMNYVANSVVAYLLLQTAFRDNIPGVQQARSAPIGDGARIGSMVPLFNSIGVDLNGIGIPFRYYPFDFRASLPLTWFLVVALLAAVVYAVVVRRTRFGYNLRVLGANPRAAEPSGVRVNRAFLMVMLVSGGIAGLIGLQDLMGVDGFAKYDYIRNLGFTGIAVALLGRNSAVGIVAAALLFSYLDRAATGIGLRTEVPKELVTILQGVIILVIVVAFEVARRAAARRRLTEVHERA